ncbi:DUF2062 domain-containing protein [Chitinibacteraceae bacterium HSL-7]
MSSPAKRVARRASHCSGSAASAIETASGRVGATMSGRKRLESIGQDGNFARFAQSLEAFIAVRTDSPMPRKFLRRVLPDRERLFDNAFLRRYAHRFMHPNLWHLNRHSVAGGLAAGLVGAMIPGPLQIITASVLAVAFRVNLPVAIFGTLVSNPITIAPLYWLAAMIGSFLTGHGASAAFPVLPDWTEVGVWAWAGAMWDWMCSLGLPLLIGLPVLTGLMAVTGYALVQLGWRIHIWFALRTRARRHPPTR